MRRPLKGPHPTKWVCGEGTAAKDSSERTARFNQLTRKEKALQADGIAGGKNSTSCRRLSRTTVEQLSERLQEESLHGQK